MSYKYFTCVRLPRSCARFFLSPPSLLVSRFRRVVCLSFGSIERAGNWKLLRGKAVCMLLRHSKEDGLKLDRSARSIDQIEDRGHITRAGKRSEAL